MDQYVEWLQGTLDGLAAACEAHARAYDESPPERLTGPYAVLRDAWDGYRIILKHDDRYSLKSAQQYKDKGYKLFLREVVAVSYPKYFEKTLKKKLPEELRWY